MGHTHEHGCCEHCLHHCGHCDVVYCCKCERKWGGYTYYQPCYSPYTTTIVSGTTSGGTAGTADACAHEH